jgi:Mrp family chromosome partitioning ATPase
MAKLGEQTDIIIYDTPPLLAVTDAQVVGRLGDGVLLVINTQQTSSAAVHRALESLAQVNVPVMGAVLNRLSGSGRSYYYYYYYYTYGSYYAGDDDHKGKRGKNSRRALAAGQQ